MFDIFDELLNWHKKVYTKKVSRLNHKYNGGLNKMYTLFFLCLEKLFCILIAIKKVRNSGDRVYNKSVVISLTSYPARIKYVPKVLFSIQRQSIRPYKVILYLSELNFPRKESQLPSELLDMVSEHFEIRWVHEDLKPHKKYFYVMQDFKDKIIITVDDDMFYRRDMVERLLKLHYKYPKCICANYVHDIVVKNGKILPYRYWGKKFDNMESPSHLYLAVGFGGVLYPPNIFKTDDLFDKKKIRTMCLNADDLWLKVHELRSNIPVASGSYYSPPICLTNTNSLTSKNVSKNGKGDNDFQWDRLNDFYNLNEILIKFNK